MPLLSATILAAISATAATAASAAATAASSGASDGLVDFPIAGSAVYYLDGSGWTASSEIMPPRPAECTFEPNTDYNHGETSGGHTGAKSKQECCAACAADSTCAAAVFTGSVLSGSCWLKTAADLKKKSSVEGVTACVVKAAPGTGGKKVSIKATVPGDLLTDLERAGLIGDPLYELNWLNSSLWDQNTWTYTTEFNPPAASAATSTSLLVMDGVKMGARVLVDGKLVGPVPRRCQREGVAQE
eukprot:SAG22_NODE_5447_length_1012_cov_1.972618_1_plen_243_part_10